jgi:mannose-1-phosphate guanylyltransferase
MTNREDNMVAIIMAGGVGTRFWPLSTAMKPKQFLHLFGDRSLLQKSFDRIASLIPVERILVLTNAAFVPIVREQLPLVPPENVIGEPMRRDTAAAVTLGAVLSGNRYGNPVIVTLTADHMINPVELFQKTLLSAVHHARNGGALYTFGISPTFPATGYGYLELGRKVTVDDGIEHFQLVRFKEKPDLETARRYLDSGKFYWNSGMFVWTAETILKEVRSHLPGHVAALERACLADRTQHWEKALEEGFAGLRTISIDYAVMEKAADVRCVASSFQWMDVGGWLALQQFLPVDPQENRYRGQLVAMDASENVVFCDDPGEQVVLLGVRDLVVVRTGRKTLIVHKNQTEDIKKLLNKHAHLS